MIIVDHPPVADLEAVVRAIRPDRSLDIAGKGAREGLVKLARVDDLAKGRQNSGATGRPVALGAVGMNGSGPLQNAGPNQEIMNESVDRDQGPANLAPSRVVLIADNEKVRQNHAENFVGDAVNTRQRTNKRRSHLADPVGAVVGVGQAGINPSNQITTGNIAYEQLESTRAD
jgi:hypothetical protein